MSKFLDPRDRYFDSVSSISFKSSTVISSDSRVSQGLLRLHSLFWEKSKKQSFFFSWKSQAQGSLYKLWREVFKDHPGIQDFETILKVMNKRKSKVDDLWSMLKVEEIKHKDLQEKNRNLELKLNLLENQVKTSAEKSIQVSFLQDSSLRKTHSELIQRAEFLLKKEDCLKDLEDMLDSKFDQLIIREKNMHQKEINGFVFNDSAWSQKAREVQNTRTKIFPEIDGDFWLQVVELAKFDPGKVTKLQEYEEELFKRYEEIEIINEKIKEEALWLEECKCELIEKEARSLKLNQINEVEFVEDSNSKPRPEKKLKVFDDWNLEINENVECDSNEYLKIGIKELKDLQRKGVRDESILAEVEEAVIKFGEKLLEREESFEKIYAAKNEYLETAKNELNQMKKMVELEKRVNESCQEIENQEIIRKVSEVELEALRKLQETVVEKHSYLIEKRIFEVSEEELEIKKSILAQETETYEKLNEELKEKLGELDKRLFEFKRILQLMMSLSAGNVEIFKQEVSKILFEHEKNPEITKSLKVLMSVYFWLSLSYSQAQGKDILRAKLTFYLLRVRVLILKKGFALAPVYFSTPSDCMWLEIFWLRSRHHFFSDIYAVPHLSELTKQWYFKFIIKKIQFAFEVLESSRKRAISHSFYDLRNRLIQSDKIRTKRLYSKLIKIEDRSCWEIQREMNAKEVNKILPLLKKFNKIWSMTKKIFLLKWKNFSEKKENEYFKRTVFEIYSGMSELMISEFRFKEECRANQDVLKAKTLEASKMLDKILF